LLWRDGAVEVERMEKRRASGGCDAGRQRTDELVGCGSATKSGVWSDVNKGDYAYKKATQARRANSFVEKRATGEGKGGLGGGEGKGTAIEVGDGKWCWGG
jgi:hypothetical protein